MWMVFGLATFLFGPGAAFSEQTVTTCYTESGILGRHEDVEKIVKMVTQIFAIHGQINRMEANQEVSIRFLVSTTAVDANRAREQTDANFVKKILAMLAAQNKSEIRIATRFLGCKTDKLE